MSRLFASDGQSIGASASVLPMNIQGWFPSGLTGLIFLQSKGLPRVVTIWKLGSPLDCKEIKPVSPEGNQPWISIGRTVAEAKALVLWSPGVKSWLAGKYPDAGKDWRQEETGDEMVGWYHWLNGHEFEQTLGVFLGFPCGSAGKESACNAGDLSSMPGLRSSPGERKSYPL